ncbi:MAG TPA: GDYXXLXY domain-containing protein [Albitalea sp.]|uniref:GDYXXLXY domain-containing protein n=1 Tax=Piscinibacter sp. TaxID=1903157 RepID=UPI002ED1D5E2
MNRNRMNDVLAAAVAEGLVPHDAQLAPQDTRPWPVVLLTALGAWLAAIPLIGVVALLLGDWVHRGAGPYLIGPLVLAGAIVVLRARQVPLFFEQLAVPALLVGGGALAMGLFRDLPMQAAAALLAAVAVAVAIGLPRPWLRVLLGAAAAVLLAMACVPDRAFHFGRGTRAAFGIAWHLVLAAWLAAMAVQRLRPRGVAALESIAAGALLATLAGLAWWSGMSFLVGASAGGVAGEIARDIGVLAPASWPSVALQVVSGLLAAAAAGVLGRAWPVLRRPWCAGVALALLVLAGFMPALGAVLLALALCAASHRWRLAGAAAVAAAWVIGSFYYALDWPLATKALVMVAAGAVLGALAWWAPRVATPQATATERPAPARRAAIGIALTAVAALGVANVGIWQKQSLIADGQPVFVELAPVDPRSLMQGDYMALNFRVPDDGHFEGLLAGDRPRVVARRDERGVATLLRRDTGAPLAADELRIELTPKNGRWTVVTDAWFFREGESDRWSRARYGEFRVDEHGRALLVGLRGADLKSL